jgi:biopolymer transport protein TolR
MAVSIDSGGKGRRKDVNADLLLVPYIDLLTCMVAFLLITAVWTQLARLEVRQKGQGEAGGEDQKVLAELAVLVHPDGFAVIAKDVQHPVPQLGGHYDYEALAKELQRLKAGYPDRTDLHVMSEDAILYETLIKVMDAGMASGFPDVSLTDASRASL